MALQLDIIIPQYKEDEKMIKHLLSSIENQVGIAHNVFKVTIVNDHSDVKLSQDFLNSFDYEIQYLETERNGGAGLARQYGMDHTDAPYILFCDADDQLYDASSLLKLLSHVRLLNTKQTKGSYIGSNFYEEFKQGKAYDLIEHDKPSMIGMHAKLGNRAVINEYNFKFHNTLRTYEDTYFGKLVALSDIPYKGYHCDEYTYLGQRNPDSVTAQGNHDDKTYLYGNNDDYITCNRDLMYQLDGKGNRGTEAFFTVICFTYYIEQLQEFNDNDKLTLQKINNMNSMIQELIDKYIYTLEKLTLRQKAVGLADIRMECVKRFELTIEQINWNDGIKQFGEKANNILRID